ncbi:DUF2288 domain-containing protein [Chlorogloeopsis fritschii PCC 9212]|jgi:hypothetical protein|uniref:DUF2288 domain-containing protein n=1 Tax=Chlorogloeopsis fritschii PCC 6912 TaxID=211165 RepID=A0A3S0Y5W4_CHLFR|nr:DUF2288 domain-containing protein [Chlorogloeopsis fritschii]MBF2007163.1 DUF2288 family protein [Chlorogloeopsis fritschii C42_A2020_084]RUR86106.1 hypothetical protein PCC6912_09310 [Chlorogloeopsis fritschii PCC 6912]
MTNQDLRAELTENLDEAEWEWLVPHMLRDAVIVVNPELDLLDVGVAIASDNVSEVQIWIDEALIAKPSTTQMTEWNSDRAKRFNTLIVQPFVLVQEKAAA